MKQNGPDPAQARLDAFAADILEQKTKAFGYPVNLKSQMISFYKWFAGSGLNLTMANNPGDPFDSNCSYRMNSLQFEREVIEHLGPLYGIEKEDVWGIVTFSGTDGNNHGIYFGANCLEKLTKQRPVLYVSDAAHYSSRRLADLQNLEMRLIPSDPQGCMIPEALEAALVEGRPALMVYALGTTFKGGVDDREALDAVLARHPSIPAVYRHIDAALFGGYLPYTRFRDITDRRVRPFDSIAVSGHKFFGMDDPAGFFLTTKEVLQNQNPYEVSYLNGSMPMINCSRSAITPLKFWWIFQHTTEAEFARQAEAMLENARALKEGLDGMGWPAWLGPMSNTVYFKRPPEEIVQQYSLASDFDERLGGALCHIVVMQHVTQKRIQAFLDDLAGATR